MNVVNLIQFQQDANEGSLKNALIARIEGNFIRKTFIAVR
jgi:hypothetical protein